MYYNEVFVAPVGAPVAGYREQISGVLYPTLAEAEQACRQIMFALNSTDPNDVTTHVQKSRPLVEWQNLYAASQA